MRIEPKLRDTVKSLNTGQVGTVIEVNNHYGWFKVRYEDGGSREYRMGTSNAKNLRVLTLEQYADYLLNKENMGITDYWRE